jgi:hypothetical protein
MDKGGYLGLQDILAMSQGMGGERWVLYEDSSLTMPLYRSCKQVHVYAVGTKWDKTEFIVTTGTTGLKSESKNVNTKVYAKVMEKKLIPACRQLMEYTYDVADS